MKPYDRIPQTAMASFSILLCCIISLATNARSSYAAPPPPERDTRQIKADYSPKPPLNCKKVQTNEYGCMMCNCLQEAGNDPASQKMVHDTVLTRFLGDYYKIKPRNVCQVIYDDSQFSWTIDSSRFARKRHKFESWQESYQVCEQTVKSALSPDNVNSLRSNLQKSPTNYHADYVQPYWRKKCEFLEKKGTHLSYRCPPGQEDRVTLGGFSKPYSEDLNFRSAIEIKSGAGRLAYAPGAR